MVVATVGRFSLSCLHYALIFFVGSVIAKTSVEQIIVANNVQTAEITESAGQMMAVVLVGVGGGSGGCFCLDGTSARWTMVKSLAP
jgi:hypothetical protein